MFLCVPHVSLVDKKMHLRKCFVVFDGEVFRWTLIMRMLKKRDNKTLRTFKPPGLIFTLNPES